MIASIGRRDLLLEGIVPGTIGGFGRAEVDLALERRSVDLSITPDQPVWSRRPSARTPAGRLDFDDGGESLPGRFRFGTRRRAAADPDPDQRDQEPKAMTSRFLGAPRSPSRRRTNSLSDDRSDHQALGSRRDLEIDVEDRLLTGFREHRRSRSSEVNPRRRTHMDVETKIGECGRGCRCVVFIPRCYRMRASEQKPTSDSIPASTLGDRPVGLLDDRRLRPGSRSGSIIIWTFSSDLLQIDPSSVPEAARWTSPT